MLKKPNEKDDKCFLVVAGQLYGSGKTYLGQNFIDQLRKLLAEFSKDTTWACDVIVEAGLEDLLRAKTVEMTCEDVFHTGTRDPAGDLAHALWKAFYSALFPNTDIPSLPLGASCVNILQHFEPALERQPIFLMIDEISVVEDCESIPSSINAESNAGTGGLTVADATKLSRYYWLWHQIKPLIRHKKVYVYACGRQELLSLAGLKLLQSYVSPTGLKALLLDTFNKDHIKEIMRDTPVILSTADTGRTHTRTVWQCRTKLRQVTNSLHRFKKRFAEMMTELWIC